MVSRNEGLLYEIGQGYSELDAQAHRDRLDGYGVVSGLKVTTDGTDLTLDVSSGSATVGQTSGSVDTVSLGSATTVTLASADASDPRKDTIYIDSAGSIQAETGTAEAADPSGNTQFNTYQPEPPYPSTEGTILAEVWIPAGASSISSGDIRDRRQPSEWVGDSVTAKTVGSDELSIRQGRGFLGLPNHHINYASGLTDEEVARFTLAAGDVLELWRLEVALKGGGTDSNVSVDVYDVTNTTSLGSVTAGNRTSGGSSPLGTSGAGATISVRVTTGGSAVDICTTGITSVVSN